MTPQYRKVNVTVLVSVSPDRTKTPLSLTFEDGRPIRSTAPAAGNEPLPQRWEEPASGIPS